MPTEVVFYFDVLGFSGLARGQGEAAVDVLTDLATCLSLPTLQSQTRLWEHRYALSDSVFLTHTDAVPAVRQAAELAFNLFQLSRSEDSEEPGTPILIRGGLGLGAVTHLRGVFDPEDKQPRNLVGSGVLEAVQLEQAGLRGPRIFLRETLLERLRESAEGRGLMTRLLRPTDVGGVWELLWPLPIDSDTLQESGVSELSSITDQSLHLLAEHGGHENFGAHYREMALLVVRSAERYLGWLRKDGESDLSLVAKKLVPQDRAEQVLRTTSGLPPIFVLQWRDLLRRIRELGA